MNGYAGRLEGVRSHRIVGWARALDPREGKARVRILMDGAPAGEVMADRLREDLARRGVGDGAYGFALDILPLLSAGQTRCTVRALAGEAGVELPGSPIEFAVPGDGRAERFEGDELVGWAHGPTFAPARLLVLRGERTLLTWPCDVPRADLARKSIGTGRHGFRLPLLHFVEEETLPLLTLRVEGTGVDLPMPSLPRAGRLFESLPAARPRHAYPSAAAARRAILAGLWAGASPDAVPPGTGLIGAEVLQHVLNRLARLEQLLAEQAEHRAIIARRHAGVPAPEPMPPGLPEEGSPAAALFTLLALTADGAEPPGGLTATVEQHLVPAYRAAGPEEREAFHAALLRHTGPGLLAAVMRTFRANDFLEVPALAQERQLLLQADPPALPTVRYQRLVRSWHEARVREPLLPAPALRLRRDGGRTLYALWRSVPYDTNGYATRSHYLLRGLRARGEDVIGITRLGYPWDAEKRLSPAAQVEAVDGVPYWHLGGAEAHRNTMPLDAYVDECAERIAQVAVATGAGVIHSASNWMAALPALRAARLVGLPFCYEMRGLWEITRASNVPGYAATDHYRLFHRMEGFVARNADLLFTITAQVREEMARRGVDPGPVRLAPNGCEVARFEPQPRDAVLATELGIGAEEMVFGYIGTFAGYEGLPELCRAAAALHRRGVRFRLLLVGDGPALPEVAAVLASEDHGGRILLRGRVPFTEVPRYYSLVDVAVFPRSAVEITEMVSPLKPFEAMAMAKPVVGSDVRAIADIVRHGETGWLFRKGDLGDLVGTLEALAADPAAVRSAGMAARRFVVENHDWSVIADRIAAGWADLRAGQADGG